MGWRVRGSGVGWVLVTTVLLAGCAQQVVSARPSSTASSARPTEAPSPAPTRQTVRGIFVLDLNEAGPRCHPVLLEVRADHRISITLSASEGAEAVPPCEVALDA